MDSQPKYVRNEMAKCVASVWSPADENQLPHNLVVTRPASDLICDEISKYISEIRNAKFSMTNAEGNVDIYAMCRMCHHRLEDGKCVQIFDAESATSIPISMQIVIFGGIEVQCEYAECAIHQFT